MFDSEKPGSVPSNLATLAPGPALARVLASIDIDELSGYDRVLVVRAEQRMISHYQARAYASMAAIADVVHEDLEDDPQLAYQAAAAEIRVALRLTRRTADLELDVALDLWRRLPQVGDLLARGLIDAPRAKVIVGGTRHLSIGPAQEAADELLRDAPELTTSQLAARLRRLCLEANPDDARDRYQQAVAERRVVSEPTPEGTADLLGLDLPPHRVAAARRRINRLAKSLRRGGEARTIDQLRADVLLDLLTGSGVGAGWDRGMVDIHVDLTTLTELRETPGELAGYGPVVADIARKVAAEQPRAEWRYTVTDDTGRVISNGITRRRPTTAQRREVHAVSPTCVFPGCRMPAIDCDLDHRTRHHDGGPTETGNLDPLCRHDHHIKDTLGWTYQPRRNGTHHWTTRLGHTYTTGRPP